MRARSQESRAKARVLIRRYSTIVLPASTFQVLARIVTRESINCRRFCHHYFVLSDTDHTIWSSRCPAPASQSSRHKRPRHLPRGRHLSRQNANTSASSVTEPSVEVSTGVDTNVHVGTKANSAVAAISPPLRYIPEDLVVFSWFSSVSIFTRASVVLPGTLFVHVFFPRLLSFRLLASSSLPCLIMDSQIFKLS